MSAPYAGSGPVDAVRAQLAELCGSDDEQDWAMLGTVLDAFVEGSAERLAELVGAVHSASVPQVEFLAHRLRGSALTLGLDALAHVCGRLEADAREGLVDGSGQLTRALVRELEAAVGAVEHVRASLPADTPVPVPSGW